MRSQSWILHYLGYLFKFHRTLSRMQKASQSVGKTSKPDGRVIFTPQKWIKNQIYNPCTRFWDRIETCRFLTPVKETSEHMRSPYSTPHIYGLERAISSPGVPFVVRHWPKGSRPLRKRSVLNAKFLRISALLWREVGYIKYINTGFESLRWRLLSIILGLKTFQSWLILFPPCRHFIIAMGILAFLVVTLLAMPLTSSGRNWRWPWQLPSLGPVLDKRTEGSVVVLGMIKWQRGKSWWQACLRNEAIARMAEMQRIAKR